MARALEYTLAAGAAALAVGGVGAWVGGGAGVWVGAGVAFALQVLLFWGLFVWLLPGRVGLAYGLGVMARFLAVGLLALLWLPRLAVAAGPTLFALVAVFFVSTVCEPLFLKPDLRTRR